MHVRATRQHRRQPEDIKEALLHVAVYAGVPAANRAFKIAKRELCRDRATKPRHDVRETDRAERGRPTTSATAPGIRRR